MITVVAGLPRSGTSLMMQMLKAGGMDILSDGVRTADDSNPRGYFEYEKVKSLARDHSWIRRAEGKVLKVITQLVPYLPPRRDYRIIYMVRPVAEVIRSQAAMLASGNRAIPASGKLEQAYAIQVERVNAVVGDRPRMKMHHVLFQEVLSDPCGQARALCLFLGRNLDIAAMADAVDENLWRQRGA